MVSTGVDIESVARFKNLYTNQSFINRIFTKQEIEYCMKKSEPYISFAGRFCAKEAVLKAINNEMDMKDIEVVNSPSGKPVVYIKGEKSDNISCSISHTEEYAVALVVVLDNNKEHSEK